MIPIVIVPYIEVQAIKNLMLKDEITKETGAGNFSIDGVKTIDEAMEVLTGIKTGKFPKDTINFLIDKRIKYFTKKFNSISDKKDNNN